jgi:hypothetical protein
MTAAHFRILLTAFLCLAVSGCGKKENKDTMAIKADRARQDSLFSLIRAARDRSPQEKSRIVNPATVARPQKFSSFSDSTIISARKKPAAGAAAGGPDSLDTAGTLAEAIATNAKIIKVDSGSAEDRRLDSLMLIANTLSSRYQQMVMTHTHANLAAAAHQDPAKTRRLLNTITEKAPDRIARNKRNNELRQERLQAIERQMQMQSREKQ